MRRIALIFLLLPALASAEAMYTTGLDAKVTQTNKVRLQWSANIQKGKFYIYRSDQFPIKSLSALSNSKLVSIVEIKGEQDLDLYRFPPYYDKVEKSGDYYYLVLPELTQVTVDDILIGINLNIYPVTVVIPSNTNVIQKPEVKTFVSYLSLLVYNTNRVKMDWFSSVKKQQFVIYRNNLQPISSPSVLNYSKVIAMINSEGSTDKAKNAFKMPSYFDRLDDPGEYYYAVLPKKDKYESADFIKDNNFNSLPILIVKPEPQKEPEKQITPVEEIKSPAFDKVTNYYIQKIFAKKSDAMILLHWELNSLGPQDFVFNIYRSSTPITGWGQVSDTVPFAQAENEFHFEDYQMKFGSPYYYAVVLQGKNEIDPGKNATVTPMIYDGKDIEVPVITEIVKANLAKLPDYKKPATNALIQPLKNNKLHPGDKPAKITNNNATGTTNVIPIYIKKTNILIPTLKTNMIPTNEIQIIQTQLNMELSNDMLEIVEMTITNKNKPDLSLPDELILLVTPSLKPTNIIKIQPKTNDLLPQIDHHMTNTIDSGKIPIQKIEKIEKTEKTNTVKPQTETNTVVVHPNPEKNYIIINEEFVTIVKPQNNIPFTEWKNDDFITEEIPSLKKEKKPEKPPIINVDYFGLGIKYYKKNNYNIAVEYLKKALESADSSNKSAILFYLGKSYYQLGNYKSALPYFAKLREYDQKLGDVWINLTLQRLGE